MRSHRFAASNNPALLHTQPECTYDELASDGTPVAKPRTKYKILEERIGEKPSINTGLEPDDAPGELEGLLKQQITKDSGVTDNNAANSSTATLSPESDKALQVSPGNTAHQLADHSESSPNATYERTDTLSTQSLGNTTTNLSQQLLRSDWPSHLPQPDLLYHLVDIFFNCYPHARYLLHRPSFMTSLMLSPKSPKFPHVSLLHAICAYAGVFSYLVDPPPTPDLEKVDKDFIFGDRRQGEYTGRDESFAEQHARWSKETCEEATARGFNLLECTQGSPDCA